AILLIAALIIYLRVRARIIKFVPVDSDIKNRRSFQKKYKEYRKSKKWEDLNNAALKKASYTCEICGKPAQVVHHKTYPSNFKDDNLNNLQVLCKDCHYKIHKKQIDYKKKIALFSESILSGKQHFRIEVREAKNQSKYVVFSELRDDEKGRSDDIRIIIFEENLGKVIKGFTKAINYILSRRN
ncbi:MAG: HNH endonuclease signature motif containing protein, partial [Candidatus Electryonea clarkiae]|nr:HNH endonuclease signature motif containing protein [Candidatus Electryonea clarkiae]